MYDHIISLAKESGLQTTLTSGFFNYEADLDAVLAIAVEVALKFQLLKPVVSYLGLRFSSYQHETVANGDH